MSNLLLTGAGSIDGSFSPSSLSPFVWYDFSTTAGGDAAIASINDLSGNNRTASQATGANQPISKSAIQNGLNIGRFNGTSHVLTSTSFSQAQPFVVYAALANATGANGRYFASHDGAARCGANTGVTGHDVFAGTAVQPAYAGSTFTAWRQVTIVVNGASTICRSNGAQDGTGAAGAGTIATGIDLGATAGVQFWAGDFGEVFAVSGSTVSTQAEAWLKAKWATP